MKFGLSISIMMVLLSASALSESKQEQYEKYQKQMNELLNKSQSSSKDEASNVHQYKNTKVTFTDCKGKAINPSMLIMPNEYPVEFELKHVVFKFTIGSSSTPENIEVIEGDDALAKLSKGSLERSKFESKYATCWLAKYEYN